MPRRSSRPQEPTKSLGGSAFSRWSTVTSEGLSKWYEALIRRPLGSLDAPMALPTTDEVCELLHDTLTGMVEGTADPVDDPPDEVRPLLDKLLEKPSTMRDGMLTLLGYVVANADSIDFRAVGKFPGGRAVAQYVADDLLPGLNIAGRRTPSRPGSRACRGTSTARTR